MEFQVSYKMEKSLTERIICGYELRRIMTHFSPRPEAWKLIFFPCETVDIVIRQAVVQRPSPNCTGLLPRDPLSDLQTAEYKKLQRDSRIPGH